MFHDAKPEWEWTNLLLPERTEWAVCAPEMEVYGETGWRGVSVIMGAEDRGRHGQCERDSGISGIRLVGHLAGK